MNEMMYIYGKNAVAELLKSGGSVDTIYVASSNDKSLSYIVSLAKETGAVVKVVPASKLVQLCNSEKHQGVVASASLCEYKELEYIFSYAEQTARPPFIVIADGIEDPHNLGAIIRTAVCAGAHGVIIPQRRGCSVTAAAYKASAGACSHIPIVRVVNLAAAIRDIKSRGVFCYCADAAGDLCYDVDLTGAAALVVGSEGSGVSRLVRELCDKTIRLPMLGQVNSLNASVAAGVLMYEFVRQNNGGE